MSKDKAFLADMAKIGIMTSPIDGEAVRALLVKASQASPEVKAKFARLLAVK
jgi:hypothetical protein